MEEQQLQHEANLIVERFEKVFAFDKLYQGGQSGLDIRGKYQKEMDEYLESIRIIKGKITSYPVILEKVFQHRLMKENFPLKNSLCDRIQKWFPKDPSLNAIVERALQSRDFFEPVFPSIPTKKDVMAEKPLPPEVKAPPVSSGEIEALKKENRDLLNEVNRLKIIIESLAQEQKELEAKKIPVDQTKLEKTIDSYKNLNNTILGIFSVLFMNKTSVSFAEFSSAMTSIIRHIKNHNKHTGDKIDVQPLEDLIR